MSHQRQLLTLLKDNGIKLKLKSSFLAEKTDYLRRFIRLGKIENWLHNNFGHQGAKGPNQPNVTPVLPRVMQRVPPLRAKLQPRCRTTQQETPKE